MQVEEHLLLYARIKGVEEGRLASVAGDKMVEMDLLPFRTTKVNDQIAPRFCPLFLFLPFSYPERDALNSNRALDSALQQVADFGYSYRAFAFLCGIRENI